MPDNEVENGQSGYGEQRVRHIYMLIPDAARYISVSRTFLRKISVKEGLLKVIDGNEALYLCDVMDLFEKIKKDTAEAHSRMENLDLLEELALDEISQLLP